MPPPNQNVAPGWYVWNCYGCPLRILVSLKLVEELRREFRANSASGGELGGLLIGSKQPGVTRIFEFIPLPFKPQDPQSHFALSPQWFDEVMARCPSDGKVVGYYRSDLDQLIRLRDDDLALMQQRFREPNCVCLVIASARSLGTNAGLFYWHAGIIAVNPALTFPLSAAELEYRGWPIQFENAWTERAGRVFSQFRGLLLRGSEAKLSIKLAVLGGVLALLITALVSRWAISGNARPNLGLQVREDGTRFSLSWDRNAQPIEKAKEAELLIWDASRADADGNTEPLHLPLPLPRLRSGSLAYTSFAPTEKVQFRLDVIDKSGRLRSETITSTSPVQAAHAGAPPVSAAASPVGRSHEKPRSTIYSPAVTPNVEVFSRKFAAPQPSTSPGAPARVVMLEPPANVAGLADPQKQTLPIPDSEQFPSRAAMPEVPPAKIASRLTALAARATNASLAGMVTITSEPSGAEVQINGAPAGVTPVSLQISPVGLGFTVTVTKEGYSKWSVQTAAMDKPYSLHASLSEERR